MRSTRKSPGRGPRGQKSPNPEIRGDQKSPLPKNPLRRLRLAAGLTQARAAAAAGMPQSFWSRIERTYTPGQIGRLPALTVRAMASAVGATLEELIVGS